MLSGLLEGVTSKFSGSWFVQMFTPAFIFWAAGFALTLSCNVLPTGIRIPWTTSSSWSWQRFVDWFDGFDGLSQLMLLLAALLLISVSATILQRSAHPLLRVLEGYGWIWPERFRKRRTAQKRQRVTEQLEQWEILRRRQLAGPLTNDESRRYNQLDQQLHRIPTDFERVNGKLNRKVIADAVMPTELGNILRTAERNPQLKYGLDSIVCWPRLWFVLPKEVRTDIGQARSSLDNTVVTLTWSVLFISWAWITWLALPAAIVAAIVIYRYVLSAAMVYGDLFESAYDVHRFALYRAYHWPLPDRPRDEPDIGRSLTQHLWFTHRSPKAIFVDPGQP